MICSACFFITMIKDIENPNKIHSTTSELSKFGAIEQGYIIPLSLNFLVILLEQIHIKYPPINLSSPTHNQKYVSK